MILYTHTHAHTHTYTHTHTLTHTHTYTHIYIYIYIYISNYLITILNNILILFTPGVYYTHYSYIFYVLY